MMADFSFRPSKFFGSIFAKEVAQILTLTLKALNVSLKVLDVLKHIFQSDVIIINNEGALFIWETYHTCNKTIITDDSHREKVYG